MSYNRIVVLLDCMELTYTTVGRGVRVGSGLGHCKVFVQLVDPGCANCGECCQWRFGFRPVLACASLSFLSLGMA